MDVEQRYHQMIIYTLIYIHICILLYVYIYERDMSGHGLQVMPYALEGFYGVEVF